MSDAEIRALERRVRAGDRSACDKLFRARDRSGVDVELYDHAVRSMIEHFNTGIAKGGWFRRPRDTYVRPVMVEFVAQAVREAGDRRRFFALPCGRRRGGASLVLLAIQPVNDGLEIFLRAEERHGRSPLVDERGERHEPSSLWRRILSDRVLAGRAPYSDRVLTVYADLPVVRAWLETVPLIDLAAADRRPRRDDRPNDPRPQLIEARRVPDRGLHA